MSSSRAFEAEDLVFVGFNSRVAALDRRTGDLVWAWRCPKGQGFVALLLDRDRLLASVNGYTYALHPGTGRLIWENPLKGFGTGVPCLASVSGTTAGVSAVAQAQAQAAAHAASSGSGAAIS